MAEPKRYTYTVTVRSLSDRGLDKTKAIYDSLLDTIDTIENSSIIENTDKETN